MRGDNEEDRTLIDALQTITRNGVPAQGRYSAWQEVRSDKGWVGKAGCAAGRLAHCDEGGQGSLHAANAFVTKCVGLSKAQVDGFRKIASTHLPGQKPGADRTLRLAAHGAELEHVLMVPS